MSDLAVLEPYTSPPTDENADLVLDPYPNTGRRAKLAVSWQHKEIIRDLGPHLKTLTYGDNLSGAADDLSLELEDRDELWAGDWKPEYGDTVVARIQAQGFGWFGTNPVNDLRLGTFTHDKISLAGPPHRTVLGCISAALATGLRRRKRTHAWRGVTLKQIAQDMADRASLTLEFDGNPGSSYKQALQNDKSDLEFLQELCKEVGRTLKVTEDKIVIYDEMKLDAGAAVGDIDLKGGKVIFWDFSADESGRYGSCHVSCFDPRTGKTSKGQFPPDGVTVPGLDPNGQTLELAIEVSDIAEAQARAQALLRNANRFANHGKMTVVGDCGLVAGVVFNLTNAQALSGKFIINHAQHQVGAGYTVGLEVRRCLEGY